jgi:16S rRNA (guanine966-N2)-methyltransferase
MRVIAGSHRGRRLSGPQGTSLRPTSDKVREALFSILGSRVSGGRFLDLYAGTGAVGIEALSRGASGVTFVEADLDAVHVVRKNLSACGLLDQAELRVGLVETFFRQHQWKIPYDVVFADPPYDHTGAIDLVLANANAELLAEDALIVIEQDSHEESPTATDRIRFIRRYEYGDTALVLYGRAHDGFAS